MDTRPTHLDLFSGIGGFALAAQWAGFRTIGFCEIDGYCRKVLAKNFRAMADAESERCSVGTEVGSESYHGNNGTSEQGGNDPIRCESGRPRIFGNIFDLNGTQFRGVSLITGGFPCQPFSVAGKRGGATDDRAIWPEMFRVISEARPAWVLGENVPGIIPMELDNVLSDLEGIGYATRAFVIPACAVDARHRRDRVWILGRRVVGNGEQQGLEGHQSPGHMELHGAAQPSGSAVATGATGATVAGPVRDTAEQGLPDGGSAPMGNPGGTFAELERPDSGDWCRWEPEPVVGRVAHGIPSRVDRLKGLGNAIVPQVAYEILREIRALIP